MWRQATRHTGMPIRRQKFQSLFYFIIDSRKRKLSCSDMRIKKGIFLAWFYSTVSPMDILDIHRVSHLERSLISTKEFFEEASRAGWEAALGYSLALSLSNLHLGVRAYIRDCALVWNVPAVITVIKSSLRAVRGVLELVAASHRQLSICIRVTWEMARARVRSNYPTIDWSRCTRLRLFSEQERA